MPTRDPGNGRIAVWLGASNAIANLAAPKVSEIQAMLLASEAIRWDGYDFGPSASDRIDDRSIADDASAQIPGFAQFGGAVPFFWPRKRDTFSILRKVYDLLKVTRTELIWVERVGWKSWNDPIEAGDVVNVYRVMNDGFNPDTEGDGGYAYIVSMLPKGDVHSWTIVAPSGTPAAVTVEVYQATIDADTVGLAKATYQGHDITRRAEWSVADGTKASAVDGILIGLGSGTTEVTAAFPGATPGSASVTITAPTAP